MSATRPLPLVLAILDGWGHREERAHNAIQAADTPHWDALWQGGHHALLDASELEVGLPEGQMGNSEVGHMNIGAGRVVLQDLPRIDVALRDGTLARHPALLALAEMQKSTGRVVHLMGLLSDGGVHAHQRHLEGLADILSQAGVMVRLHAFLDGRDTPPKSAQGFLAQWEARFADNPLVSIATISGRYYAMDRDNRWARVQQAYNAVADAVGEHFASAEEALSAMYARDLSDEFVLPCVIGDYHGTIHGDALLMANFRADRAREILHALTDTRFEHFERMEVTEYSTMLGMVEYSTELNEWMTALFPQDLPHHTLGEVLADAGLSQLRIAETEKYAHVTFFFNGGREQPFVGEDRVLIPSPSVATYDLKPEMSAPEMTDRLVAAITQRSYDVIIVNYANTDMVGHTGNMQAAIQAVQAVDQCVGRLWEAVQEQGGVLILTADHGNAEMMHDDDTAQSHTAHTLNKVPLIIAGDAVMGPQFVLNDGRLCDIAPTILHLLGLTQPTQMTGHTLLAAHHAS
ncbi:MAG: 2,3-bisphosphoglycerate-independent phosphoglycerate mutase [Rickettsiales bacterium]|nr:2,3-bisphosphoglycerate-independent phosphoglycerate mutase [Rickettsiales bacterium]